MPRSRSVLGALVLGLLGALVGVVPRASAGPARSSCRATAYVTSGGAVSTIDVKTGTKNPTDITVGAGPVRVEFTPDGKTAFVTNGSSDSVSTIDVKTRIKDPTDIAVGSTPPGVAVTPDGKTAFVANQASGTVSTIDVKTRAKYPTDIAVGANPVGVAVAPCRR
jgi:YVTN family beta-propeller protein